MFLVRHFCFLYPGKLENFTSINSLHVLVSLFLLPSSLSSVASKQVTSNCQVHFNNQVQFNNRPASIPSNGYSQYHTVHKDSGLYKDLLHKLHLAKVGDCMGEGGDRPIRRNNSYTSYTMAIIGMHGDFKSREADFRASEDGDKGPHGQDRKRMRMDSYTSYCNAVAEHTAPKDLEEGDVTLEMAKEDADSSQSSLDEDGLEADKPEVSTLFQFLQILTACFGSFAHGGNDVRYAETVSRVVFLLILDIGSLLRS